MRVALVGLGDIARKAYLPVLAARPDVQPYLVTRNRAVLDDLGLAYRIDHRFTSLDDALADGMDAAFVHAASAAHHTLVTQLLTQGVPVYVDKPLDLHFEGAKSLVTLAEERGISLMVGFNRRYAPAYRELADWPDRRILLLQKHRVGLPDDPRRVVFDDFIHVADTMRFLGVAEPEHVDVTAGTTANGQLENLAVQLRAGERVAIGLMSRTGGLDEEILEVVGRDRKRRVVNLAEVTRYEGGEQLVRRDEWRPVAHQRGFSQICGAFLDAVRDGRRLSATDALATHELCERIVGEVTRQG